MPGQLEANKINTLSDELFYFYSLWTKVFSHLLSFIKYCFKKYVLWKEIDGNYSNSQLLICQITRAWYAAWMLSTRAAACPVPGRGACAKKPVLLWVFIAKLRTYISTTTNSPDILASDYIIPTGMSCVKFYRVRVVQGRPGFRCQ